MRALIWIVSALALLYAGYWVAGARTVRGGAEAALSDLRDAGLADYDAVNLHGFPSRFDLTVDSPVLRSTGGGVEWSAPFVQVFALSYHPNHVIVVWPNEQTLRFGRQTIAVTSTDMRASAVFGLSPSVPLDHSQLVGKAVGLDSDLGWGLTMADFRIASRIAGDRDRAHDLGGEALAITPSDGLRRIIDPTDSLPEQAEWVRVDATFGFDGPLDRYAGENGIRITDLWLTEFSLRWGDLELVADGAVSIAPDGTPDGRIVLSARRWREMLRLAVAAGLVRSEIAPTIENALSRFAELSGSPDRLDLPLIFANGRMSLGPIPLGPAPRF